MTLERMNIQFVQEVQQHPCLYDHRLPEYSRREATEKAWEEIGAKFQLAGAECKERWKNIRSVFVRHLKPAKPGFGKLHKKPYYLAKYMRFAVPFVKPSVIDVPENLKLTDPEVNQDNGIDEETEDYIIPTSSQHPESIPLLQRLDTTITPELTRGSRFSPVLSAVQSLSSSDHTLSEKKNLKRKKYDYCNDNNSNRMFLLSLLSDMNKMGDKQKRIFKRRVLCLVDEILDGIDSPQNSNTYFHEPNSSRVVLSNDINDILNSADRSNDCSMIIKTETEENIDIKEDY